SLIHNLWTTCGQTMDGNQPLPSLSGTGSLPRTDRLRGTGRGGPGLAAAPARVGGEKELGPRDAYSNHGRPFLTPSGGGRQGCPRGTLLKEKRSWVSMAGAGSGRRTRPGPEDRPGWRNG